MRDDARLPRARSRENEEWAVAMLHGAALRLVEGGRHERTCGGGMGEVDAGMIATGGRRVNSHRWIRTPVGAC